jgi:hypothetical protein
MVSHFAILSTNEQGTRTVRRDLNVSFGKLGSKTT